MDTEGRLYYTSYTGDVCIRRLQCAWWDGGEVVVVVGSWDQSPADTEGHVHTRKKQLTKCFQQTRTRREHSKHNKRHLQKPLQLTL